MISSLSIFWCPQGKSSGNYQIFYVLEGDGYAWASALSQMMRDMGFTLCRANGYLWTRLDVDTSDIEATTNDGIPSGERYYEYFLIHMYNLMVAIRGA